VVKKHTQPSPPKNQSKKVAAKKQLPHKRPESPIKRSKPATPVKKKSSHAKVVSMPQKSKSTRVIELTPPRRATKQKRPIARESNNDDSSD